MTLVPRGVHLVKECDLTRDSGIAVKKRVPARGVSFAVVEHRSRRPGSTLTIATQDEGLPGSFDRSNVRLQHYRLHSLPQQRRRVWLGLADNITSHVLLTGRLNQVIAGWNNLVRWTGRQTSEGRVGQIVCVDAAKYRCSKSQHVRRDGLVSATTVGR